MRGRKCEIVNNFTQAECILVCMHIFDVV